MHPVRPLANEFITLFKSPEPKSVYCYSPGIARSPSGRLIATLDLGGSGVSQLPGAKANNPAKAGWSMQGRIFTSDDHGEHWDSRGEFTFFHARPFAAGSSLYILGHAGDLAVIRSDDDGVTWSEPAYLSQGESWHQAPCNVHYANGYVYLVMEKRMRWDVKTWYVHELAPILLRGKLGEDLTKRVNWTFASELAYCDAVPEEELSYFSAPFYEVPGVEGNRLTPKSYYAPFGWLETNVIQFTDPRHVWCDASGHTLHLWMRAHTGGTGYAAIAKVVENSDGTMTTMLEHMPSGKPVVYVPCPGGNIKFHILYDEISRLFWLLSSQATDSMIRPEFLPEERHNSVDNERHRLQLHFSKNGVDWCFAGIVAIGKSERHARHYASMVIDGDDLQVLSRSGDGNSFNAHDTNFISLHTISNFRKLIY